MHPFCQPSLQSMIYNLNAITSNLLHAPLLQTTFYSSSSSSSFNGLEHAFALTDSYVVSLPLRCSQCSVFTRNALRCLCQDCHDQSKCFCEVVTEILKLSGFDSRTEYTCEVAHFRCVTLFPNAINAVNDFFSLPHSPIPVKP